MCRLFKSSVKYIVKSDALKSVFCLAGISLVGLFTKEVWQKVWTFGAYTSKCWNVGLYDLSRTKHFSHIKKKKSGKSNKCPSASINTFTSAVRAALR